MAVARETLATLFEDAPRFVDRLAAEDATSTEELLARAEQIALAMPEDEQIELLNGHPRIGADPSTVSALSFREQGYDHDSATADLQHRLDSLNDAYESRFGFRFVVFVNGRSRAEIADVLAEHLESDRDVEKERGLGDVIAIARSRAAGIEEGQLA
jgi:2-oxo-4-hydroxy-4-carboxy--5-ureidoimidazoline (OHCU) decarboxylase